MQYVLEKFRERHARIYKDVEKAEHTQKNINVFCKNGNDYVFYIFNITKTKTNFQTINKLKKFVKTIDGLNPTIEKFINAVLLEKVNINLTGTLNGVDTYLELYGITINEFKSDTSECVIDFTLTEKEKKTDKENNLDIDFCNGNYKKIIEKDCYGINSIWVRCKGEYRGVACASVSVDIETDTINGVYQCVSFSMGSNSQTWYMTTKEIAENDKVLSSMFNLLVEVAPNRKDKNGKDKTRMIKADVHNLSFDGSYFVTYLLKNGFMHVETVKQDNEFNVLYASGILSIKVKYKGVLITFRDTFRLMSSSLDSISKGFIKDSDIIIKKSDTRLEYNKGRKVGEQYTKNDLIYCINDVVVTSYIHKFFSETLVGDVRLTSSACALNEYKLSMRYGCLDTDTLIYILKIQLNENKINENNYKTFLIKKNDKYLMRDYYGDNVDLGITDFNTFKCAVVNYITPDYQTIYNNALDNSPVMYYLVKVKNWTFDYSLAFCLYNTFKGQEKFKEKILSECYFYYFPKILGDDAEIKMLQQRRKKEGKPDLNMVEIGKACDDFIRRAYFGGLTCVNPDYVGIRNKNLNGFSIDINSSYPDKLSNFPMPYGCYHRVEKENRQTVWNDILNNLELYQNDYLCLVRVYGIVEIKDGEIPLFINKSYNGNGGQIFNGEVDRYISLQEYLLASQVYDMEVVIKDIVIFKAKRNLFKAYYNRYYKLKTSLKGTALYGIVKVLLNGLYGKFGENIYAKLEELTFPELDETGTLKFTSIAKQLDNDISKIDTKYLPVAVYTTSFARCQLIGACHQVNENGATALYTDTDSIYINCDNYKIDNEKYLIVNGNKTDILVDGSILGAWDLEHTFHEFIALAPKRYGYIGYFSDDDLNHTFIKCAGISKKYQKEFTLDDLSYSSVHKSLQSQMHENGRQIQDTVKVLGYNSNIYLCDDGLSFQSKEVYSVGDTVETTYHKNKKIKSIIYME